METMHKSGVLKLRSFRSESCLNSLLQPYLVRNQFLACLLVLHRNRIWSFNADIHSLSITFSGTDQWSIMLWATVQHWCHYRYSFYPSLSPSLPFNETVTERDSTPKYFTILNKSSEYICFPRMNDLKRWRVCGRQFNMNQQWQSHLGV